MEIKVGQHWQEVGEYSNMPVREVMLVGPELEGRYSGFVFSFREITFRSIGNGRTSVVRTHTRKGVSRFIGSHGGYKLVKEIE